MNHRNAFSQNQPKRSIVFAVPGFAGCSCREHDAAYRIAIRRTCSRQVVTPWRLLDL
jgi:hypothetical protein